MGVNVVEVLSPTTSLVESPGVSTVIEVVQGASSPVETTATQSAIEVVMPSSTVVNVQAGTVLPSNPYEGQVFLLLS